MKQEKFKFDFWGFVKGISVLSIVVVICIKIYQTPIDLKVDFPTLLSLLLGFFSVSLAALFYFKATETSNNFYDNTYKFTNQISELLAKIESGFGEKLRSLDEGYASMRNYIQNPNHNPSKDEIENTKNRIKEEQREFEKVINERNEIIKELISKSQLQQEEKNKISEILSEKESQLHEFQNEISKMKKKLFAERLQKRSLVKNLSEVAVRYTREHVLEAIGGISILNTDLADIRQKFDKHVHVFPKIYISDLEEVDYYKDGLTYSGAKFLYSLAQLEYE